MQAKIVIRETNHKRIENSLLEVWEARKKVKLMFSGFRRIVLGLASMKILIFLVVWFHKLGIRACSPFILCKLA